MQSMCNLYLTICVYPRVCVYVTKYAWNYLSIRQCNTIQLVITVRVGRLHTEPPTSQQPTTEVATICSKTKLSKLFDSDCLVRNLTRVLCVTECCVWQNVVCDRVLCVTECCACDRVLCLCVCDRVLCVTECCVYVTEGYKRHGGGRQRRRRGAEPKHEKTTPIEHPPWLKPRPCDMGTEYMVVGKRSSWNAACVSPKLFDSVSAQSPSSVPFWPILSFHSGQYLDHPSGGGAIHHKYLYSISISVYI